VGVNAVERTAATWIHYWDEYNDLFADLRAAVQTEWAATLEDRGSGGATGSEVIAIAQRLDWYERSDAMLDYIALPLDDNSRVIPSSRIPPPATVAL